MVHPCDRRVAEDRDTRTDSLRRVVDQCRKVRVTCEAKASDTLVRAIHNHESAVWKGHHARHDPLRGLYVQVCQLCGVDEKVMYEPSVQQPTSGSERRAVWLRNYPEQCRYWNHRRPGE